MLFVRGSPRAFAKVLDGFEHRTNRSAKHFILISSRAVYNYTVLGASNVAS